MKARICENCVYYEQHTKNAIGGLLPPSWAPRCTQGLNPALAFAKEGGRDLKGREYEPDAMAAFCDKYIWAPVRFPKLHNHIRHKLNRGSEDVSTFELPEKFAPFFERGSSVRIRLEKTNSWATRAPTGYVSISTGWRPVFILMASIRSRCSPTTLTENSVITGVREAGQTRFRTYKGE